MSSRRQRSIALGVRYRQVSLYHNAFHPYTKLFWRDHEDDNTVFPTSRFVSHHEDILIWKRFMHYWSLVRGTTDHRKGPTTWNIVSNLLFTWTCDIIVDPANVLCAAAVPTLLVDINPSIRNMVRRHSFLNDTWVYVRGITITFCQCRYMFNPIL